MQVQKLLKLLRQNETLSEEDIPVLQSLIESYPYCYLAHALLAKLVYIQESDVHKYAVQKAATYATNRAHFRAWLENKLSFPPVFSVQTVRQREPILDNSYLEIISNQSVQKSTNETSMRQFMVIDRILHQQNLQFDPEVAVHQEEELVDLSERGITLDNRFATETLARIMVKQKKYQRALDIYTHLRFKHPEKQNYFDCIIVDLQNRYMEGSC